MTLRGSRQLKEVTVDVVKIAREQIWEIGSEDVTVTSSSWWNLNKWRHSSYVLVEKLFLKIESTPGEDTGKIFEMTWKDTEYSINLVFKTVSGSERTDSNFERSPTLHKMLSKGISFYREIICERFLSSVWQASLLYLRHYHSHPNVQQTPPWLVSSHQPWHSTLHHQNDYDSWRLRWWLAF